MVVENNHLEIILKAEIALNRTIGTIEGLIESGIFNDHQVKCLRRTQAISSCALEDMEHLGCKQKTHKLLPIKEIDK